MASHRVFFSRAFYPLRSQPCRWLQCSGNYEGAVSIHDIGDVMARGDYSEAMRDIEGYHTSETKASSL